MSTTTTTMCECGAEFGEYIFRRDPDWYSCQGCDGRTRPVNPEPEPEGPKLCRCGQPVRPPVAKSGRNPEWCSDACSKRTRTADRNYLCPKCGGPAAEGAAQCRKCLGRARSTVLDAKFGPGRERMAALYRTGMSLADIAVELGMTKSSVTIAIHRLRHHYGYDLPYRYDATRKGGMVKFHEQIGVMWRAGDSVSVICQAIDRDAGTIHATVKRMRALGHDVPPRRPTPELPASERYEHVAELWREGLKIREIADRLDVDPGRVGGWITRMRRYGYDLPYRHLRTHKVDAHARVASMYLTGTPVKDIAAAVGKSPASVNDLIYRMRNDYGYDLPYRINSPRTEASA